MKRLYFGLGALVVCVGSWLGAAFYKARTDNSYDSDETFRVGSQKKQQSISADAQRSYLAEQKKQQKQILEALPQISNASARRLTQWDTSLMVFGLHFSPDGSYLAVVGDKGSAIGGVELHSTANWNLEQTIPGFSRMVWSPNSRLIAIENDGVDIWDVTKKRLLLSLSDGSGLDFQGGRGRPGVWTPQFFSADSSKLATMGEDPQSTWQPDDGPHTEAYYARDIAQKVWDVKTGKLLLIKPGFWSSGETILARTTDNPAQVDFAARVSYLYTATATSPRIYAFDGAPGYHTLFDAETHPDQPFAMLAVDSASYCPIISGNGWVYVVPQYKYPSPSTKVQLFCSRDRKFLLRFAVPSNFRSVAISPDARTLAIAYDHPVNKYMADGSTVEVSRSGVTIYHLSYAFT